MPMTTALGKFVRAVRERPGDAVSVLLLIAVAATTTLDLFGAVSISSDVLSRAAIIVGSVLALQYVTSQGKRREAENQLVDIDDRLQRLLSAHEADAAVLEIASSDIGGRLDRLLEGSSRWYFRGGSGRWQRSSALPTLAKKRTGETDYLMQLVDPRDQALCTRYAQYRALQRSVDVVRADEGNPEVVRDDLLACIYAAGWYGERTRVAPRVFLSRLYSPMRVDIGAEGLMLTVADKKASGVFAPGASWYYHSVVDEMKEGLKELSEVLLPAGGEDLYPTQWRAVSASHVERFFSHVTVRVPGSGDRPLRPDDWAKVDYARIAGLAFEGRRE